MIWATLSLVLEAVASHELTSRLFAGRSSRLRPSLTTGAVVLSPRSQGGAMLHCRTCGRALIACLHEPLSCCPSCHENGEQHG